MLDAVLETLFPRGCLLCGLPFYPGALGSGLCQACDQALPRIRGKICRRCGKPLLSEQDTCLRCRNASFFFDQNRSVLLYVETGRLLISQYKFSQERHLSSSINALMKKYFSELVDKPDYLVPVPPSPSKARKRGWDPVRAMAEGLSSPSTPVLDILRKKEGREQKSLDFAGRMENIKGRFVLKERPPEGASCLIVDDVFTTGATVSECARILTENGAGRVGSLTLVLDP